MRPSSLCLAFLASLALVAQTPRLQSFRQWIGGQEVGGSSRELRQEGPEQVIQEKEWIRLSRAGQEIKQEVVETVRKSPDGSFTFSWSLKLSAEPFEGKATWSPKTPGILYLYPAQGAPLQKEVPQGALLWPDDLAHRLMDAARDHRPLQASSFSFPIQQWSQLNLEPVGPSPLPGFPDTIRFKGQEKQGSTATSVEVWISPTEGEVKHLSSLGSLSMLTQRKELPAPDIYPGGPPASKARDVPPGAPTSWAGNPPLRSDIYPGGPPASKAGDVPPGAPTSGEIPGTTGFFEQTLQSVPAHPFLPWLPDLILRAEGNDPALPEDAQQIRLGKGRWRLSRAKLPTAQEAGQMPLKGHPSAEELRFLAPTPLVPFQDPAFDGLLRRMALPAGLSRWELARRVTSFVFEWVVEKDYSVGFASALEVCRNPRGDCTEHGILAVALLRKLGVPARGVTGWVALSNTLGLHFWVEVRLLDRWVPVDPTFDQAPASAFRLKVGDTDLADLGSVGWEMAPMVFSGVRWIPEQAGNQPWPGKIEAHSDVMTAPDGLRLRVPGGNWDLHQGQARLRVKAGSWSFTAMTRPTEQQLQNCRKLAGPNSLQTGWWNPATRGLWMDLGSGRWLLWSAPSEAEAFYLLDQLRATN